MNRVLPSGRAFWTAFGHSKKESVMAIKAIQTRYKGYNFRSRLEARWAVFFDALGIKWEYEPEGFEFGESGATL